jgi:transmembrane protein
MKTAEQYIEKLLESPALWFVARLLLCVVFVASGLAKILDFNGGVAEMRGVGLEPAVAYNVVVALTMVVGSALLFLERFIWLGAGILGVFLFMTIIVVHHFWALPEPESKMALFWALEHTSLIGGLMATAIAGHFHAVMKRW